MPNYSHQSHARMLRDIHNNRVCKWFVSGNQEITIESGYIRRDAGTNIQWTSDIVIDGTYIGVNGVSGALQADTDYFIYIVDDDTTAYGYISDEFVLSALPGATTAATCIGWLLTDGSAYFVEFSATDGDVATTGYVDALLSQLPAIFPTHTYAAATYLTLAGAATTYLTLAGAATTYLPLTGGTITGTLDITSTISQSGSGGTNYCLLYTSPSPRDGLLSRMPSSA